MINSKPIDLSSDNNMNWSDILIGGKVILDSYRSPADIMRFCHWTNNQELLFQFAPSLEYPVNYSLMENRIHQASQPTSDGLIYRILLKHTQTHIGHIELANIDSERGLCTICHFLIADPPLRSRGLGTDVLHTLLRFVFLEWLYNEVYLFVLPENICAISCYHKIGFQRIGCLSDVLTFRENSYDLDYMKISAKRWLMEWKKYSP